MKNEKENLRKSQEFWENYYKEQVELLKEQNKQEKEEHEKQLNKWKAMYTGQAEANAKLINKYEN